LGRRYWAVVRRPLLRGSIGNPLGGLLSAGAAFERETLEVRERLGDREPAGSGLEVVAEQRKGDLVGAARLLAERGRRGRQAVAMVGDQLAGATDRVAQRIPVARERERRAEVDRRAQRVEVVPERVGAARRPEADRGRDPVEEVVGGDEHAVPQQHQLAVGVARRGDRLPAVHDVARVEEPGVALEADERPVGRALLDQLVGLAGGHAVTAEPLDEHTAPVLSSPDERTLGVVDAPLENLCARQLGEVGRRADVVRVEVRDDDPPHRGAVQGRELRGPALPRVGEPEARVDHRPAVVAGQDVRVDVAGPVRQRQRDAADAAGELLHRVNPTRRRETVRSSDDR
jgi:hypothetical protein